MQASVMNQNQELSHADTSNIQALQQKRTLAFVNHFVTTNVQFLNNFMKNCEQKLMTFERKLEKVNAAMVLVEARLSSIPELNVTQPAVEVKVTPSPATEPPNPPTEEGNKAPDTSEDKTDSVPQPEYERFLKMVQVGVPVQAVKLKVSLEGLDPNVLDQLLGK